MARRTKQDAAKTRALIVHQACELFERNGYMATTLDDIAHAASVTKGAIFHHFKSKQALFLEIWTTLQTELNDLLFETAANIARKVDDPYAGILASAKAHLDYVQANKAYKAIVMTDGPQVLGMDEWISRDAEFGMARVKDGLRYLVSRKVLPDTGDLDELGQILLGTLNYAAFAMRGSDTSDALVAKFEQLARGLDTRPPEDR